MRRTEVKTTKPIGRRRKCRDIKSRHIKSVIITSRGYTLFLFIFHFLLPSFSFFPVIESVRVLVSDRSSIFSAEAICVSPICMDQRAGDSLPSAQPDSLNRKCSSHFKLKYSLFSSVHTFYCLCRFKSPLQCCGGPAPVHTMP